MRFARPKLIRVPPVPPEIQGSVATYLRQLVQALQPLGVDTADELLAGSVGADAIVDGAVGSTKLAAGAVLADKVGTDWPHARVRRTTNQSVATGLAGAAISFDALVDTQVGNLWVIGSPTRLTLPRAGVWIFGGCVRFDAGATGWRHLDVRSNGTTALVSNFLDPVQTAGIATDLAVASMKRFAASEYLELFAAHAQGANLNVLSVANVSPELWAVWVGP